MSPVAGLAGTQCYLYLVALSLPPSHGKSLTFGSGDGEKSVLAARSALCPSVQHVGDEGITSSLQRELVHLTLTTACLGNNPEH